MVQKNLIPFITNPRYVPWRAVASFAAPRVVDALSPWLTGYVHGEAEEGEEGRLDRRRRLLAG